MKYIAVLLPILLLAGCAEFPDAGCVSDSECRFNRVCLSAVCTTPLEIDDSPARNNNEPSDQDELPDPGAFSVFIFEIAEEPAAGYSQCDCDFGNGFRYIVFAQEDGTATLFYEEGILGHGFNPTSEFDVDTRRRIDTHWEVEDEAFNFGDWLECKLGDDEVALACVVTRPVVSPAVESRDISLRLDNSAGAFATEPSDPSYDAYVAVE